MAELIWTIPALQDLDAIADYIALEDLEAARRLIKRVFEHVAQLAAHPESGSRPAELRRSRYRQIVEPPCRIFLPLRWIEGVRAHVMRGEIRLRKGKLRRLE